MLCPDCRHLPESIERATRRPSPGWRPGWERLRPYLCERCGLLLPRFDPNEAMLHRIARLARFGLSAGGAPILRARSLQ